MRLIFILYVFCVGATMQGVSDRLSAAYQSATQTLNKHLGCLDKAYKRIKQEARGAFNKVVSKFRGGDIEKVEDDADGALLDTQVDEKVENFKKKLQEIINAMKEKQQRSQENGPDKEEEAESAPGYELSDNSSEEESSEVSVEKARERAL